MIAKQKRSTHRREAESDASQHPRRKAVVWEPSPPEYGSALRAQEFAQLASSLDGRLVFSHHRALVAEGDSLELLRSVPPNSVSLVLTDPPYHATKKRNIYGDTLFAEDQHYLDWMAKYAAEWHRILKPSGSLYCFCDSSMSGRLEVLFSKSFNVLSHIVWTKPNDPGFDGWKGKMKKEALRQWYPHSERILFAEPAREGNLHRSPLGLFLREMRTKAGLTMHELTGRIGAHGKVNHGGAVSNWEDGRNTPSREQYARICRVLVDTGKITSMPPYEDVVRIFNMDGKKEFTDVWTFESVRPYKGKHPAEKPSALLEHAIAATTNQGDIVLDCFAGGGSTAIAALKLGRRSISMEIEPKWTERITCRLAEYGEIEAEESRQDFVHRTPKILKYETPQLSLFPVAK